ncbi:MAG TPA: hypothetical protein VIG33_05505 [Pseudobdellovibrionaceae bacterium]
MKKMMSAIFVTLMVSPALAQTSQKNYLSTEAVERYLLTLDYNSWFEKLTITNSSGEEQKSQSLYYGFGVGLEKNWYQPNWGWGLGTGVLAGSAVGGDKSGTLTYFQARVPWWGVRLTPRLFYRWNPRTDFGLDLSSFYKQGNWPAGTNNLTAKSGADLISGAFIDMRIRFNQKIEMMQSFGVIYKDESIYWRIGLAYRL